jgi:hypothetical protein
MVTDEDKISNQIIGAAIEVHRALGPGLLESALWRMPIIKHPRLSIPAKKHMNIFFDAIIV